MDKKALIGDLLDLFYLVVGTVVIFLAASFALNSGINSNNQKSLFEVGDFNRADSAINNLKILLVEGGEIDPSNIEDLVKRSRTLAGRTITSCFDYRNEFDCNANPVKVGSTKAGIYACRWDETNKVCLAPI